MKTLPAIYEAQMQDNVVRSRRVVPTPFERNHCVVMAYGHAARFEFADTFVKLAEHARKMKNLYGRPLLDPRGAGYMTLIEDGQRWADLVGLKVVKHLEYGGLKKRRDGSLVLKDATNAWGERIKRAVRTRRPRMSTWVAKHRTGTWVIASRKHAIAVINGHTFGRVEPNALVTTAYKLVEVK